MKAKRLLRAFELVIILAGGVLARAALQPAIVKEVVISGNVRCGATGPLGWTVDGRSILVSSYISGSVYQKVRSATCGSVVTVTGYTDFFDAPGLRARTIILEEGSLLSREEGTAGIKVHSTVFWIFSSFFLLGGVFLLRRKEPALLVLLRQSNSFGLKDENRERTSKR